MVGRTNNHGRAHIRCLMPAHTCVCKRYTAAGSTSKNNPIISILKDVFLFMLMYVLKKQQQQNIRFIRDGRVCVCVGGGGVGYSWIARVLRPVKTEETVSHTENNSIKGALSPGMYVFWSYL